MTVAENPPATFHGAEILPGDVPGGPSTSQTIMVSSLQRLLSVVPSPAPVEDYRSAVIDENVLGKQTAGGREWAFRQLRRFYGLNPELLLFRALRDLWTLETAGQPLLAILCALARDPVLRASTAVILASELGADVGARDFDAAIEDAFPGAYSDSTRRTTAQKVASSWQQPGHLHSQIVTRKTRCRAVCTLTPMTYALLLGHLQGVRGLALFNTLWTQVLDQPASQLFDLATKASQHGMFELRHAGGVVDMTFHELLRPFNREQEGLL